jgi:TolB-like protein
LDAVTSPLATSLQQTLGDAYQLDRELGGGGMSRVFLAHEATLDRDVVIKVLSDEASAGVSADRFRREIQLIARLQHPNVVSILAAGSASGSLYYVMPFVSGETLRSRLVREGPLPIPDVVRLLREVLDALAFAHDHGVVHRDVKPENVLIEAGHGVLADFGIAKALEQSGALTSVGFAVGTPAYMAPEQATADPMTDHRADLYSVGVLGYELLTGAAPFAGTAQQLITAHLTTTPAPLNLRRADAPHALAELIMRALEKDPADRPQRAREMMAVLDTVMTPAQTVASAGSSSAAAMARRRMPFVAAVLLAAAAGIYAVRMRTGMPVASSVAAGADLIAVMPLSAVSDSSLARLGQDLVVTLSTNLDGVGSLHTVDAVTLLMRARKLASPLPLVDARALAHDLGARSVLTGTLINDGDRVRATVVLHPVGSDSAIATATALATPRDVAAITDSLTWGILQQVWRRGTPPSPVLTGITTRSVDALRAFLEGERHFQHVESEAALADYRRAFDLDSNFVQAFLRYEYVNEWAGAPPDSSAHARLLVLKGRLPERERLWVEAFEQHLSIPAKVAHWKALAQRYPDYPPILMAAADPIIHFGPLYGIPIRQARPYLDRLEQLVPEHGDTRFHVAMVNVEIGSSDSSAASLVRAASAMGPPWSPLVGFMARYYEVEARAVPGPPRDSVLALGRALAREARRQPKWLRLAGLLGIESGGIRVRLAALEQMRAAGVYPADVEQAAGFGEGLLRSMRGDWMGGQRAFRRAEGSALSYSERMTTARTAVLGAWVRAVDLATADSALTRARAMRDDDAVDEDRVELLWLDGVLGVLGADESRVRRAGRGLATDTLVTARQAARSLAGLWLARTNPDAGADTLKAVSDEVMRGGDLILSAEAIDRLVVSRALRHRGAAANVERYLMWTDAATNIARQSSVKVLTPLVNYERGVADEEAGDRAAAILRLRRFLEAYDQPPAAHRALVEDARKRLAALERTDAPARRAVTPR